MGFESIVIRAMTVALFAASAMATGATLQRTFVASNGNDANPCNLPQPCRTFAAAIAKTNDAGEVIVLDSGGYGAVSIHQSVSIVAPAGIYAGISVFSGSGITVVGVGIKVRLRGLTINGQGAGVLDGIQFVQGAELLVEDCEVAVMSQGVAAYAVSGNLVVRNSVLRDNGNGFGQQESLASTLDGVTFQNNAIGVYAAKGRVTVNGGVFANNTGPGAIADAFAPGSDVQMYIARSTFTGNDRGIEASATAGNNASVVSDSNVFTYHDWVFDIESSGGVQAIYTRGNNSAGYYNFLSPGGSLTPLGPI